MAFRHPGEYCRGGRHKSAYETFIGTFPTEMGRPGGYAVDCNDDYAYITVEREGTEEEKERMMKNAFLPESNQPVKIKPTLCGIRKMNLSTGEVTKVIDTEFTTGHIQASRCLLYTSALYGKY